MRALPLAEETGFKLRSIRESFSKSLSLWTEKTARLRLLLYPEAGVGAPVRRDGLPRPHRRLPPQPIVVRRTVGGALGPKLEVLQVVGEHAASVDGHLLPLLGPLLGGHTLIPERHVAVVGVTSVCRVVKGALVESEVVGVHEAAVPGYALAPRPVPALLVGPLLSAPIGFEFLLILNVAG
eukprot:CAMPEP_0168628594 /NCGR_PEP_ID=MMETSP0449_2-20121227/11932_1 /TAXON_ID=1082188 /ORGANISM="Strombidium rassoulzadegani, Strain ras09" /LENGTH=180 /DNA_ID=CAMNT_0008671033 /DNA_START=828 /DNA_END=1367 /DNA_ORIENTATION=-